MSQKPTAKNPVQSRVSSGVPWWLWGLLLIVGGGILASMVISAIPADPAKAFSEGLAGAEAGEALKIQESLAILSRYPEYAGQQKLLEGISAIGRARPLYAIPLLEEASKTDAVRSKALQYLGMAHIQADERAKAISVFESLLKDDENAHAARNSLAMILNDNFALEESLKHLAILIEKEFRVASTNNIRGDSYMTMGRFKEAADAFEASIMADATDPTNSVKSNKLVQCLIKTKDFERADKFIGAVDQKLTAEILKVETSLANGKVDDAITVLNGVPPEGRTEAAVTKMYGKAMLAKNTPEAAREALASMQIIVMNETRDQSLYELTSELARVAGETELANLAQQNVDQLAELNKEYDSKLMEVVKTRDDQDLRLQLAELAYQTGRIEMAYKLYEGLIQFFPDQEEQFTQLQQGLMKPLPQLVSTEKPETPAAAQTAAPETATPETTTPPAATESEKPPTPAEPATATPEASTEPAPAPAAEVVPAPEVKAAEPASPAAPAPEKAGE